DPTKLVRRLVHLAKFRAWAELENKAPNAALQKKLQVEVLALPADFDPRRRPWPEPKPFAAPIPVVTAGPWIALRITKKSPKPVNITVLALQPDWGISVASPPPGEGDFESLDPSSDGGPLIVPLRADLPAGYDAGDDLVKVIAALHPVGLRAAELPPL